MAQALAPKVARLQQLQKYLHGKPQRGERLIIVGGAPRSGTTMFQSMMNSHPQIHGGPEFDHLTDIIKLHGTLSLGLQRERIDLFVDQEQIDDAVAQLIESLLLAPAERHKKHYLSEKTPKNVLDFKTLMRILPRARFVHIVRDPRAVFMSMFMVGKRLDEGEYDRPDFIADTEQMVEHIVRCVTAGIEACETAPDRSVTIRYEDLLTRTHYLMEHVFSTLGLPYDAAVLSPADHKHEHERLLLGGADPWVGGRGSFTNPRLENLDKWRKGLAAEEIETLNGHFRAYPIFAALGYTFD
ncbi:sulfotransferase [Uliginosibacterium sp. H3]|uniref:Sulfotransferase n=1 Tax=Uliginosibacterium silvisoli TaxID=3114758 RepID=A0ABU6K8Q3_9RHOO|nr:sulfotransferase [Uliginosibacterium sp. H3]